MNIWNMYGICINMVVMVEYVLGIEWWSNVKVWKLAIKMVVM